MTRFIRLTLLLLACTLGVRAADKHDLPEILLRLDSALNNAPRYEEAKLSRIAALRRSAADARDALALYNINMQLFEEYRSYQNDTALMVLQGEMRLARKMQRKDLENDCLALIAYQCSNAGCYDDAKSMLAQIDTSQLRGEGLFHYYRAMYHLYNEIGYYSRIQSVKDSAGAVCARYERMAMECLDKNTAVYKEFLCRRLFFRQNKPKEALRVCDEWLKMTPGDSREYALVAYYQYLIRMTMHDRDEAIYWAARSAVSDITHAVMDQASLWAVADYISGKDIDRSYKYIKFSWKCASRFGTSVRTAQISPILSIIESEYKDELDKANHHLMVIMALIAILAVVLFFLLYYATRQRLHLVAVRNDLHQRNVELAKTNSMLAESNDKLKEANGRVTAVNAQLQESDQIKEAYIGRFLALCTAYVDRMDRARKDAGRLIKARKIDELYQQLRSTEQLKKSDIEQLYGYFDTTFLNIFPTFVDDFNALLKPENRIDHPLGKLNTTLRIFALIRLGIDDSGKIAELLHYSVNTIYNYRARTKNGCIGNRDTFEDDVKRLGKI